VTALRLIEAAGIDPKDMTRERLSVAESVSALKDRKIDAFFWVGGVPTPSITDLAATPGITVKLINHGEAADNLRKKYGPIYIQNQILANPIPGETRTPQHRRLDLSWSRRHEKLVRGREDALREEGRAGEGPQGRGVPGSRQPGLGCLAHRLPSGCGAVFQGEGHHRPIAPVRAKCEGPLPRAF
jgi:hypothetical protein